MKWLQSEKKYIENNYHIKTYAEMGAALSRSWKSIEQFCFRNKLQTGHKLYTYDEEFFDSPNPKSAYWAGFLAADGCISLPKGLLSLELKGEDSYQVENFKSAVKYTGPAYYGSVKLNNKLYQKTRLALNCAWPLIVQLQKHYNIGPRKSFSLQPPNLSKKELIKSYIVGYIDGDGSISLLDERHPFRLRAVGTYYLLSWIKQKFDVYYPSEGRISRVYQARNIYEYAIQGKRAEKILSDLSKLDVPFLKRKWDKVFERI